MSLGCVTIDIINDSLDEQDLEDFSVVLSSPILNQSMPQPRLTILISDTNNTGRLMNRVITVIPAIMI